MLAVDPGTRAVGWAMWTDKLHSCGLVRTKEDSLGARAWDLARQLPNGNFRVLVEKPRLYPYNRNMQPNDLIDLAFVAGACATVGASADDVLPVTWKGQTPKDICHKRIMKRLSYEEILVVKTGIADVPKSLQHNVLDAIGIGRWDRTGEKL